MAGRAVSTAVPDTPGNAGTGSENGALECSNECRAPVCCTLDTYMVEKDVKGLMAHLMQSLVKAKPKEPLDFLVHELEALEGLHSGPEQNQSAKGVADAGQHICAEGRAYA